VEQQPQGLLLPTFALDFYAPGADPGFASLLGDDDGNGGKGGQEGQGQGCAVLYRVAESRITHVWVGRDVEGVGGSGGGSDGGSRGASTFQELRDTRFFAGDVLDVLFDAFGPAHIGRMELHFHDYTAMPSIG
jgi:hypothetical protein